jgi:hypothetical protein
MKIFNPCTIETPHALIIKDDSTGIVIPPVDFNRHVDI